jgi:tight adherence protein B
MISLKYLALVLLLVAVYLLVHTVYTHLNTSWTRRIEAYAHWLRGEYEAMYEPMTQEKARRFITVIILNAFFFGVLLGGGVVGRLILGLLFAAAGYFVPRLLVKFLRKRRVNKIDDQLVDALGLMANSLKAGLSLQQALELVVREMKPPISDEFGRVVKEIQLGTLMDDALRRFAERMPLDDLRLAVDSVLTLRETGGNLSETFQVIATTIVERKKVEGKIKSMTAQGMTQGVVMCLMPIVLMVLFTALDPNYMHTFFTTPLGWIMMAGVFGLDGVGLWLMVKLVKVDV